MYQIIGQDFCDHCKTAQSVLTQNNQEFRYRKLNKYLLRFFNRCGYTTVPQIWHNGEYIGGCKELITYLEENK